MNEIKKEPQKVFEDLPKETQKLLHKEFNKCVETRYKIFLCIGIVLLLIGLISSVFLFYYIIIILFEKIVAFQIYIYTAIFMLGCGGSTLFTSQYHKRFYNWLKNSKNIVTKSNIK